MKKLGELKNKFFKNLMKYGMSWIAALKMDLEFGDNYQDL